MQADPFGFARTKNIDGVAIDDLDQLTFEGKGWKDPGEKDQNEGEDSHFKRSLQSSVLLK